MVKLLRAEEPQQVVADGLSSCIGVVIAEILANPQQELFSYDNCASIHSNCLADWDAAG